MGMFALAEQSNTFPRSRLDSLVIIVSEFHETRTLRPSVGLAVKVTPDCDSLESNCMTSTGPNTFGDDSRCMDNKPA